MAEGKKDNRRASDAARPAKETGRQLRRLERRLAAVRETEARRARQLEKAHRRGAALEATIAALRPAPEPGPAGGPVAYCLREKRRVVIVDPEPIVLRNGRAALAGTCPSCGARVVTTARAAVGAVPDGRSGEPAET